MIYHQMEVEHLNEYSEKYILGQSLVSNIYKKKNLYETNSDRPAKRPTLSFAIRTPCQVSRIKLQANLVLMTSDKVERFASREHIGI